MLSNHADNTSGAANSYASVSGGYGNIANGAESSVSGGAYNLASGPSSSISGGGGPSSGLTESYAYGWAAGTHYLVNPTVPLFEGH